MANFNIQIPDAQLPRVLAALCDGIFAPTDAVTPVDPTPALAKQVILDFIKDKVKRYEIAQAQKNLPPPDVSNIVS